MKNLKQPYDACWYECELLKDFNHCLRNENINFSLSPTGMTIRDSSGLTLSQERRWGADTNTKATACGGLLLISLRICPGCNRETDRQTDCCSVGDLQCYLLLPSATEGTTTTNEFAYISFDDLPVDNSEDHVCPKQMKHKKQVEEEIEEPVSTKCPVHHTSFKRLYGC